MRMKFILWLFTLLGSIHVSAADECILSLGVQVEEKTQSVPADLLEHKLRDAVTVNGMEGNLKSSYFILVASANETSREQTAGLRPLVSVTIDLSMYVCNQFTGEKFTSTTLSLNGSGRSESDAGKAALSTIRGKSKQIQAFLQTTKRRIEEYYNSQVSAIIAEANKKSAQKDYERALFILSSVPVCSEKYNEVAKALSDTFIAFLDFDSTVKLTKARNIWNASQDKEGALLAGAYLSAILPSSSAYQDALKLEKAIRERIGEEWEFYKELQRSSTELDKERIEAARAIGIAYAKNQPTLKEE